MRWDGWFAVVVGLCLMGSPASGASISIFADDSTYTVGETITIGVSLSAGPGDPGALAASVLVDFDPGLVGSASVDVGVPTLTSLVGLLPWTPSGGQGTCTAFFQCLVLDQLGPTFPSASVPDPYSANAVLTFTADAPGTAFFNVVLPEFFGAAGDTVQVLIVAPEPGGALLLLSSLGILAVRASRRS